MAEFSDLRSAGDNRSWDWGLERYFERAGHPDPMAAGQAIDGGYGLWRHVIDGTEEAVAALQDAGIRSAVVTNSDGSVPESLEQAGLAGLFELVIDSAEVGFAKPDPRIYHIALREWGPSREVPGALHDLGGARAAGLARAILVEPLAPRAAGRHSGVGSGRGPGVGRSTGDRD
ncbi:MAG: HAD family hydrolase [Acidimicrobiia bacterium]